ncbi:urea ABC transporter permease subunit UrtB [Anthocerotibacter panamensis]|uniref:urea ABC transporter permease subunit UrtB n=1 Tax=Anthocerotibacter panamensis TaxID=2857077 RepID=UPI0036F28F88
METVVTQLFNGLSTGSILVLVALGLAITFGLMGVINMAHGELLMVGAYVTYLSQNFFTAYAPQYQGWAFVVALPLAFGVAGLVGFLLEWSVIRFLYGRSLETLLATWGVSLIFQQLFRNLFGANNVDVQSPSWLEGGIALGDGLQFPFRRLFIILLAGLCVGGAYWFLNNTPWGLRIRAVTQNREMSACLGISTRRVDAFTFALGSGLAGIAGCAVSLLGSVGPSSGLNYIVDAFMVVILGGVGKIFGAVAGGVALGEAKTFLEFLTSSSLATALVFSLIILFLQIRPAGIFPQKGRGVDL